MKTRTRYQLMAIILSVPFLFWLASCKKEVSAVNPTVSGVVAPSNVPVGISSTTNDSIYVVGTCSQGNHLDTLAASMLPSSITSYLDSGYAGYTFIKAFTEVDTSGNIAGYVVIINYNGLPVGLKFDAAGNFVEVLEQRDKADLNGKGWHEGGCFDNRDGQNRDTIPLSALPASITSYFTANYPQDTLIRAFRTMDSNYVVFSIDNGSFATLFDSTGTFVNRVQLNAARPGYARVVIAESALPASVSTYLTNTYPGYVFEQAFSISKNNTVVAYVVCIDANGTKYAILFDSSGVFVKAITFRFR